ncbi:hypothetical protein HLB44_14595 [Aquincola sp. S2]|uniref:Ligand-binding SRPBCC domain-containing protein n=1 Tax=Pseudaquabacterium terrae TaxID=2732868 RepID=A0ABX2EHX1_9BURK|nr:hypothetical protein [Aquabacterium terrae]NRF68219.1 hypothetical protein [Aquabacterium terrae]
MPQFTMQSELAIAPDRFWSGMSMRAVNDELNPLVHMTAPPAWRDGPLEAWQTGRVLFRSWVLLFGWLPVDRHALQLQAIDPAGGFVEESTSWTHRRWRHERSTGATPRGCLLTDRVTVDSRVPGLAWALLPVYRAVFAHRHRRLLQGYGAPR